MSNVTVPPGNATLVAKHVWAKSKYKIKYKKYDIKALYLNQSS